jgi:hypothetical protein
MMKKFMYLMTLTIAITLMSFSCEKPSDDPITPVDEGLITLAKLNGTWKTHAYIYGGVRYKYNTVASVNTPAMTTSTTYKINDLFRTFTIYSATKAVDYVWTSGSLGNTAHYDFVKNINDFKLLDNGTEKEKYTIVGYSNDTLRLNFTLKDGYPNLKYGTYILTK